jgi:hypothetical protein
MVASTLLSLALLSLWVAAWLRWVFEGDIRQFLFAKVFPARWRAGRAPEEVLHMMKDEITSFLAIESAAPEFVNGVLGCPVCLSAHLAAAGLPFVAVATVASAGTGGQLVAGLSLLPLLWAAGAWVGNRLHSKL